MNRARAIREANERAEEFKARTAVLPPLFQQKIARARELDPEGYRVDFEAMMLDTYEVAIAIFNTYTATHLSPGVVARNISHATPHTIVKHVPSAALLESDSLLYEAMALAYELVTGKQPDWVSKTSEDS
ncbi:MAG: hypothetical protein ACXWQ5_00050 [Ktedonobacterales bacterium]